MCKFCDERANDKKEKTWSIKWHNMIPCAFWKGSWIFQSATKGTLHILVLGWTRNERSSFAFTTAALPGLPQYLRGPAFPNPARYIFMVMYLDGARLFCESKIITALSDAINIFESQGIKRLGPGADAGRALAEEFSARRSLGCSCEGLTPLTVEPGSGETPGTVPASEIN